MAITKTNDRTKVWNYLINNGFTKAGAAGMMGNMHAESGVIPNRVQILCLKRLAQYGYGNYTDDSYTQAVDSNRISRAGFLNPLPGKQYGYGLCQWTSPGRKAGLYDKAKSKRVSIANIQNQLQFLIYELKNNYQGVYKIVTTTSSIKEASDKILKDFESPANWSSHSATRASYGQEYYNLYASTTPSQEKKEQTKKNTSLVDWSKYKGKISNSGGDQKGGARGGKAGDQTGNEWTIRGWYNRPWNCVLRYPNTEIGQWIALLGIEAANNNLIGYDQNERDTYWQHLKASNYRPSQITVACQADCSAGVIANVRAVGYLKNITALKNINATYTGNMRAGFKAAGFKVLTDSKYLNGTEYLLPGDILLNDVHHTATNLGIGDKSGGIDSSIPDTPSSGGSSKKESSDGARPLSKTPQYVGKVTASELNVRSWAGVEYPQIKSYPILKKGNLIDVCDTIKGSDGDQWHFVRIANSIFGFVCAKYVKKV